MYTWSDMSQVKKELWNKLHAAKELMKKKATNLAQLISRNANHIAKNYLPDNIKQSFGQLYQYTQPVQEQPIVLSQVSYLKNLYYFIKRVFEFEFNKPKKQKIIFI